VAGLLAVLLAGVFPVLGLEDTSGDSRLAGNRWGANYFPNVELTTHEGKTVRFFDDLIENRVVVINFIYTSCPDACPLETARLTEVKEILGDRVGDDVFFYSISIDPETDTPEVLAEYSKRYQAGPGWLFLTGDSDDITLLRRKLGLYIDEIGKDPKDHNLSMIIGNQKTGRWMKRSPFENPYILAIEIGSWLHNFKDPSQNSNKYKDIPKLRNLTQGEGLFRTRCSVCHSIGKGDGLSRTGPNLQGVTDRRDHDWLSRWLAEPDVMLEEKDSIAMGLFMAYNQVPMPNMQLNEHEVTTLIDYIETESRRVAKVESVEALAAQINAEVPDCCQKNENVVLGKKELKEDAASNADSLLANSLEADESSFGLKTSYDLTERENKTAFFEEEITSDLEPVLPSGDNNIPLKTASTLLGCVLGLLAVALMRREN